MAFAQRHKGWFRNIALDQGEFGENS